MPNPAYLYHRSKNILREEGLRSFAEASSRYIAANLIQSKKYYLLKFRLRQLRLSRKYGPVPHALEMRRISPDQIKKISNTPSSMKWKKAGTIESGDWDRTTRLFSDYDIYIGIKERFDKGVAWEDTDFYNRTMEEIENGRTKWGCNTITEFDSRCNDIDQLYRSIKNYGYISRDEFYKINDSLPTTDDFAAISNSCLYKWDEVAVDISRRGEFLFVDGRHRLAISKILDIDAIPVRVVKRHKQWQDYRNEVLTNEQIDAQHPDLADVIE